jgi:hypothetical protein
MSNLHAPENHNVVNSQTAGSLPEAPHALSGDAIVEQLNSSKSGGRAPVVQS